MILFFAIPTAYGVWRLNRIIKLKKVKKARYVYPIDFKTLPKAGPNSVWIGRIAETDVKAYMDMNQLMMHSISAGATGAGKTVSAMIVAEELLKKGIPVIVFDPTAQWTGFLKPCKDKHMLDLYTQFGIAAEEAQAFRGRIIEITDPTQRIDIRKYMKPGEITIILINKLTTAQIDTFVRGTIESIFSVPWPESKELKVLLVYDEVHRLLPKYGGKGGYVALERGCREFRKWGIGIWMISQVLMDFRGAIRANIATEVQMRTRYEGDLNRVKAKFGSQYSEQIPKMKIGTGMVQNAEFNNGKPYFVEFRPLLHDTARLSDDEIAKYIKLSLIHI